MRFRAGGTVAGLSIASCILIFVACSSSDSATEAKADGGTSSGTSGTGTTSGAASSSGTSGTSSGDDDGGDSGLLPDGGPIDSGLVPVGDGGLGAGCNTDAECGTKVCSVSHTCVPTTSCRGSTGTAPGLDTCGATDDTHDSCCTTLTLPTTTTRTLDKYEITAGRIRAFIDDVKAQNAGVPNIRKFARDFATANPTSQLGQVATGFPAANGFSAYIDLLPDHDGPTGDDELPVWLGAFPADAMNDEDGCYLSTGGYGAATYWQDPATLKVYGIGYGDKPDGTRKFTQAELDVKPQNCTPPILLAAFCAWDGGELALTSDYHEVYGTHKTTFAGAGGATVYTPWAAVVPWGKFNWRNGHTSFACLKGWPDCSDTVADIFFQSPTNGHPEDDDAPEINQGGRFPMDVTDAASPDGSGWFDIGGNMLEAAWPDVNVASGVQNFCDTSAGLGPTTATQCNRDQPASPGVAADPRPGTLRYAGQTPTVMLVGYSFEGHATYGQSYFADATVTPGTKAFTTDVSPYMFPAHFQYGKVGGRCARVK